MKIAVVGATGHVGTFLVPRLLERRASVRVITRSSAKASALPRGTEGIVADLARPETLRPALADADAVFLLVANSPSETHQALTTLSVLLDGPPTRLVYLSNDLAMRAALVPHAGAKLGVEAAIRASGIDHTILRPTYFAQNDLLIREAILAGVYALPHGNKPIARIDVRDVADAAAAALLDGKAKNQSVLLSSPDQPNGEETAALWSTALGRPVSYLDQSPEMWAETMSGALPPWLVFDLEVMYRHLQAHGHPVAPQDLDAQAELLPHGTRSYGAFIHECARDWTGPMNASGYT